MEEPDRRQEILTTVTAEMTEQGIEITSENTYWMLKGLQDAWREDESSSTEKALYMIALSGLLFEKQIDMMFGEER
jgi:hypothetical protein